MNVDTRRAALLFYGMSDSDQAWSMKQLAPSERSVLESLLEELASTGIPPDRDILNRVLNDSQPLTKSSPTSPVESSPTSQAFDFANAARIADLLKHEHIDCQVLALRGLSDQGLESVLKHLDVSLQDYYRSRSSAPVPSASMSVGSLVPAAISAQLIESLDSGVFASVDLSACPDRSTQSVRPSEAGAARRPFLSTLIGKAEKLGFALLQRITAGRRGRATSQ